MYQILLILLQVLHVLSDTHKDLEITEEMLLNMIILAIWVNDIKINISINIYKVFLSIQMKWKRSNLQKSL